MPGLRSKRTFEAAQVVDFSQPTDRFVRFVILFFVRMIRTKRSSSETEPVLRPIGDRTGGRVER